MLSTPVNASCRNIFCFQLIFSLLLVSFSYSSKVLTGDGDQLCLICQNCSHSFRSHLLDGDIGQLKSIFVEYFQNEDHKSCHFFDQLENFIVTDIPFLLNQENLANSQISVIFKLFLSVYNDNYKWKAVNIDRTFGRIKAALKQVSDIEIRKELLQILSQEAAKHEQKKTKKRVKKSETCYGPRRNFCLLCRDEKDRTFLKHIWEHSPEKPIEYFAKRYFEVHKNKRNHIAFWTKLRIKFIFRLCFKKFQLCIKMHA